MTRVSHGVDRVEVAFDDPNLIANAGLLLSATLAARLDLEVLIDSTVKLGGRVGGARPGIGRGGGPPGLYRDRGDHVRPGGSPGPRGAAKRNGRTLGVGVRRPPSP